MRLLFRSGQRRNPFAPGVCDRDDPFILETGPKSGTLDGPVLPLGSLCRRSHSDDLAPERPNGLSDHGGSPMRAAKIPRPRLRVKRRAPAPRPPSEELALQILRQIRDSIIADLAKDLE